MTRPRILHTITTFATSSGAAEYLRLITALLPEDQFEIFVASRPGQSMEANLAPQVHFLPVPHLRREIQPSDDVCAIHEIYRLCQRWGFDLVNTHNSKDGILARWAARAARVPNIVHTAHTLSFRASRNPVANGLYSTLDRATAPLTQALVAVSTENVRDYLGRGIGRPDQYQVIHSGLELHRYRTELSREAARARIGFPPRGALVAWIGRFNYQKDPQTFVRAARVVVEGVPDAQFVVCGNDPFGHDLWPATERLARQLGIRSRIHMLGFRTDIPVILTAADILMHSSRYEGMGRVVCEALACQRPVAGTAVDGVREVIVSRERGGILVPPERPQELAQAAIELLTQPRLARDLATEGQRWVNVHLSARIMADRTTELYVRLLERPGNDCRRVRHPLNAATEPGALGPLELPVADFYSAARLMITD